MIDVSIVAPTDPELDAASKALGEAIVKFVEATLKPYVGLKLDGRTFHECHSAIDATCGTVVEQVNDMRDKAHRDLNRQMRSAELRRLGQ